MPSYIGSYHALNEISMILLLFCSKQGEGVPLLRKGVCANHVRDVSNVLKGAHVTVNARTEEDVDSDIIIDKVSKSTASMYSFEERLDLSKEGFQKLVKETCQYILI